MVHKNTCFLPKNVLLLSSTLPWSGCSTRSTVAMPLGKQVVSYTKYINYNKHVLNSFALEQRLHKSLTEVVTRPLSAICYASLEFLSHTCLSQLAWPLGGGTVKIPQTLLYGHLEQQYYSVSMENKNSFLKHIILFLRVKR